MRSRRAGDRRPRGHRRVAQLTRAPGIDDGLVRAHATLTRGARFLGAGLSAQAGVAPAAIGGRYRAKVIGNGLRELDRFLNVLIDEASLRIGLPVVAGQRNTANKLRAFRAADGAACATDEVRLRALGRSRDCLFHCGGIVTRADARGGTRMTAGWAGPCAPLRSFAIGEELVLSAGELAGVCAFYESLAAEVVASAARSLTAPRTAPPG
ncbi:MAG: hypothetical protein J7500_16820 [Sphingomonas sp.]|uniref:hypothetical protein n=1 Tax=Sphingomonas sp. TaxID=28214 RepID=UPI001B2C8994|nr:hypothetical protein [Sphingomonas sp.]MBO9624373.1 hypothetical protein [Sphingomonas sp.]